MKSLWRCYTGYTVTFPELYDWIGYAGSLSITLLFPFETSRTRLQVDDGRKAKHCISFICDLVREEGLSTLYRGWASLIISLSVTNFVYFYIFQGLKLYAGPTYQSQTAYKDLFFGVIAGVAAVLVSNPLWVVNTRLKLQGVKLKADKNRITTTYRGIIDGLYQIVKCEGVLSLWGSTTSSLILTTNPAINYAVYEALKRNLFEHLHVLFNASSLYFVFGAISKLSATFLTYPIQLVQTRRRAGMDISNLLARQSFQLRNLNIWFRGMESKLAQTVLTSALMLMTYEHIVHLTTVLFHLFLS